MNLKEHSIPELLLVLNALSNMVLSGPDRSNVSRLSDQRTFTRAEKTLISSLCRKYSVDADVVANKAL